MRLSKKSPNYLFVEEVQYKWAPPKKSINARLIVLSLLFIGVALLFIALR